MSMAATLGLISKLAGNIGGASSLNAIANSLKSSAKTNMYAIQVDSGEKKGWLVSQINAIGINPTVIDPNANGASPKTYNTKTEAETAAIPLQYKYSDTEISTLSAYTLMEYTAESDENIEKMATDSQAGLAQPCLDKRNECIAQQRTPTKEDYITAIKNKMSTWLPI